MGLLCWPKRWILFSARRCLQQKLSLLTTARRRVWMDALRLTNRRACAFCERQTAGCVQRGIPAWKYLTLPGWRFAMAMTYGCRRNLSANWTFWRGRRIASIAPVTFEILA